MVYFTKDHLTFNSIKYLKYITIFFREVVVTSFILLLQPIYQDIITRNQKKLFQTQFVELIFWNSLFVDQFLDKHHFFVC